MQHESERARADLRLQKGEPFNPYKMFTGIFIPEGLARWNRISAGAKLAWSRLARYAGQDGRYHPTMHTLGQEIEVGERQAQKLVCELEKNELVRRIFRFNDRGQTSNGFEFLWHEIFEDRANDSSGEGVNYRAGEGANDSSPKESHFEESHSEETNIDLDSPPSNRKNRDSRLDGDDVRSTLKQYPRLREALAEYMVTPEEPERVYPRDRLVVDVMDAARGTTEDEVIRCLHYLRNARGLLPGSRHGPRHFNWFKSVVADYFQQKQLRETVFATAPVSDPGRLSKEEFDSMTAAIEIDEGAI